MLNMKRKEIQIFVNAFKTQRFVKETGEIESQRNNKNHPDLSTVKNLQEYWDEFK